MFEFFDYIKEYFLAIPTLIMEAGEWLITKLFIGVLNLVGWLYDGVLSVIISVINGSNLLTQFATSWAGLPDEILYIAGLLQIPAAIGITLGAYVIRISIKLIPGL